MSCSLSGDGCVHPLYRNLGIGTELIRRLYTRARDLANLAPIDMSVTLNNVLNANDIPGRSLLENEGFQLVRNFYRMEINLEIPLDEPNLPARFEMRQYQPGQEHRDCSKRLRKPSRIIGVMPQAISRHFCTTTSTKLLSIPGLSYRFGVVKKWWAAPSARCVRNEVGSANLQYAVHGGIKAWGEPYSKKSFTSTSRSPFIIQIKAGRAVATAKLLLQRIFDPAFVQA